MADFYLNNINDVGGPNIFATRLRDALVKKGHRFLDHNPGTPFNNISVITGPYFKGSNNILRLDNLYFDSENPDCDRLNFPIFQCYKHFDKVIFQSNFSKKMYETFTALKKENAVIYNGVPSSFSPDAVPVYADARAKDYEKVCITSASWRRHKRLEELVEAFNSPKLKDVCLIVLGGKDYPISMDIPSNVLMCPKYDHWALPSLYVAADAMLFISWLDCCPNAVVEALACGVPVMCSHNGGTNELVGDDGVVLRLEADYEFGTKVPLYNPKKVDNEAIIEGILKVLEMPKGFTRPDLSIERTAEEYEKHFN